MALVSVFPYGSFVYGTRRASSDIDLIAVSTAITVGSRQEAVAKAVAQLGKHRFDVHEYTDIAWNIALSNGEIAFVEAVCYGPLWGPSSSVPKLKASDWIAMGQKRFLRDKALSDKCGGQKGIKSLWHSYRIALFIQQLIEQGKITDWGCANPLYFQLENTAPSELISLIESQYDKLKGIR